MPNDTNLALNIDTADGSDKSATVARIAVVSVSGYLRDGSAPTVSRDCANQHELAREVERLKNELDEVLECADDHFEGRARQPRTKREASGKRPAAISRSTAKSHISANLIVADAMTREVKTVRRNDPLSAAESLMTNGRFRHVVVVDDHAMLAGVISHRDMFYSRLNRSMGQGKYAHDNALEALLVKQIMQTDVTTVDPETGLGEAAALLMETQIGCLPVLNGDTVVGILTATDFLGIVAPTPSE